MGILHTKLRRELWTIKSQVLAIILVIMGGTSVAVMSLVTYDSLEATRDSYYRKGYFADIFLSLTRAPLTLLARIEAIEGVAIAEARVTAGVRLRVGDDNSPSATGLITSLPDSGNARLNRLIVIDGDLPNPSRDDQIVISDGFAEAHQLSPGDTLTAIIKGRQKRLAISGIALSPEHIYQIAPGDMLPDYRRYGVAWMNYTALASAYEMEGAFNNLVVITQAGTSTGAVIEQLDALLARYGGQGAYDRQDQLSARFLREEFKQLATMSLLFPAIFLGVAAFLLHIVLARFIRTQRSLIAILKAFGYRNATIALHYTQMVLIIAIIGALCGVLLGLWLAHGMGILYLDYYRFPEWITKIDTLPLIGVCTVTLISGLLATWREVAAAAALPPAEAMRPESPERYHLARWERSKAFQKLPQTTRIILRNLKRQPHKAALSVVGIAMAVGILMVGGFQVGALDWMVHIQFRLIQQEDLNLTFIDATSERALYSLQSLPEVSYAEGYRTVPAILRNGHHHYRNAVTALPQSRQLRRVLDTQLREVPLPERGVLLTRELAEKLQLSVGESLTVEVLEGSRPTVTVPVAGLIEQYMGLSAYMELNALNRLLKEGPSISGALLTIEQSQKSKLYERLRGIPRVAGFSERQESINSFYDTLGRNLLTFNLINALLGGVIAFGVVYNTVRISLSERSRELASLRVLGYTRSEVNAVLLGELLIITLLGIPLGFVVGYQLCALLAAGMASELYRIPMLLTQTTYLSAALIVLLSTLVSALIAWWTISRLDLVEVLKTRE